MANKEKTINDRDADRCEFQDECIKFRNEFIHYDHSECGTYKLSKVIHEKNNCMFALIYKQLQREKGYNKELVRCITDCSDDIYHLKTVIESLEQTLKKVKEIIE